MNCHMNGSEGARKSCKYNFPMCIHIYMCKYRCIYLEIYISLSEINRYCFHLSPRHRHLRPDLTPRLLMISQLPPQPLCLAPTQGKLRNLQEPINTQEAAKKKCHWRHENITFSFLSWSLSTCDNILLIFCFLCFCLFCI